jgi:hypothetical protein
MRLWYCFAISLKMNLKGWLNYLKINVASSLLFTHIIDECPIIYLLRPAMRLHNDKYNMAASPALVDN